MSLIGLWALLALALHLLWEVGQLPLYALWQEGEAWRIALYVAHCVLGDVTIATLSYLGVALIWRQLNWPRRRLRAGGTMLIAMGIGYTVFSEWYNVYRLGSWAYADAMPLIFGIGITPLLQWLVVPGVMLLLIQRTRIGRSWQKLSGSPSFIFF
ncbi:MAG: hypothetical protein AB1560_03460 [Pseudomonadota bacterium]